MARWIREFGWLNRFGQSQFPVGGKGTVLMYSTVITISVSTVSSRSQFVFDLTGKGGRLACAQGKGR